MSTHREANSTATYLTRTEAAELLGMTPGALAQMAVRGEGPNYSKLTKRMVRYRPEDIAAWVDSQMRFNATA